MCAIIIYTPNWEAKEKNMKIRKSSKLRRIGVCFGVFLTLISSLIGASAIQTEHVYAEPTNVPTPVTAQDDERNTTSNQQETVEEQDTAAEVRDGANTNSTSRATSSTSEITGDACKTGMGSIGWIVCPVVEKVSDAVDWLYSKIEDILLIDPIPAEDGTPIYEIWKYCLNITNVVFIIFLLIVIYSQLTGWGISNYGLKKALPKLIITAILVNLSFLICSLAVDVSNVIGHGLRGIFDTVESTAIANLGASTDNTTMAVSMAEMYTSMAGGTALAIGGGAIAFEFGTIWMLIPTVLGAIVAVATGLITIALRQAVVMLLVMISPLAFVANILPNTEEYFTKWKKLLTRMLVFYPAFSLLFGASSLAGFAIIMSAKDGFGLLLGIAVQIFPLFFSLKLMQMSGTFLGDINAKMRALTAKPLAANRAWADSRRQLTRQKRINAGATPSTRLMQFISNRKIAREEELSELTENAKLRGQAYAARRNYRRNDLPSREGEEAYARQAQNLRYMEEINRHKNNMNLGLGQLEVVKAKAGKAQKAKLDKLDVANVTAADSLKMELARGAKIDYDNTVGYYKRVKNAEYANSDLEALKSNNQEYQMHDGALTEGNLARYRTMKKVMEGKTDDVGYILADAAHSYESQSQIVRGKFKSYFDNTEATQDIVYKLEKLTTNSRAADHIDTIIAGIRTLNMRGDTDLAWKQLDNILKNGNVEIGSHALQSIASYCMFDVKGNDPAMRRFGKYINLETAKMFNKADSSERRTRKDISLYEFINGEYIDRDAEGNVIYDDNGQPAIRKTKKNAKVLLKGTSFKEMERTAIKTLEDMIREASVDLNIDEDGKEVGTFNYEKFKKNERDIWNAVMPNVIGDHFSFLSGSEQIMAMSKGLTGVDVNKHGIDWEGIFGKEIARTLTPEQKKDYIEFLNQRTKTFLGGQVPSQIARTKTDMLESIRNQYALREAMKSRDPDLIRRIINPTHKMSDEEYKNLEREYIDAIKREFVGSFKPDALKGFVKMHHKGYQGEAKDGLIQLLDPDALYREYFSNGDSDRHERRSDVTDDDDDEDGMPIGFEGDGGTGTEPIYNGTRSAIESVFESYRGVRRLDVESFWEAIKPIIMESDEISSRDAVIDTIESRLSQYTDVPMLYADIINQLFGGFGE